jgi:LysM repeat protein/Tfp pilus assembly protein PilZ
MYLKKHIEKRQYPRALFDWPVTLTIGDGVAIVGRVKDISRGGVLVHIETKLQVDKQVQLAIEVLDSSDVISAKGKVVRIVRALVSGKQKSTAIYAVSICFTEISVEDCRYFTGNLAKVWQNPVTGEKKPERRMRGERRVRSERLERQAILEMLTLSDHIDKKTKNISKSIKWGVRIVGITGLVLAALVFFQSYSQNLTVVNEKADSQHDLRLLSERIAEIEKSHKQQATIITEIQKNLASIESSIISPEQNEKNRSLLESLTLEVKQIKNSIRNQPAAASPGKVLHTGESTTHYTVRPGETIYSISTLHGLTVEKLLQLNKLPTKGAVIYPNQKLRVKPLSSTSLREE